MERYIQLPKKLGKGSFASVALIQRKSDDKLFAAKLIDLDSESSVKQPYSNELSILERLDHPNIIKFFESFTTSEHLCLVMDYCEKGDFQQMIKEAKSNGHYFSEDQILEWFCQLCLAVKYLHDNHIIHRDIKVHNIFLAKSGLIKLGDFGISKQLDNSTDLSQTQTGTPLYLTPEMLMTSTSSYKSDIWMLGCLLHELCSLEKPFQGESFPQIVHQIIRENPSPIPEHYSPLMHFLVNSLLEKDPERRPTIYALLTLPELREEVCKLNNKYPEAYESLALPTKEVDYVVERAQRMSSDDILTSTPVPITRKKSSSLFTNYKQYQQPNQLSESPPRDMDNELKCESLSKTSLDTKAEPKLPNASSARKSNNIWSLVKQKKKDVQSTELSDPSSHKNSPPSKTTPDSNNNCHSNESQIRPKSNSLALKTDLCEGEGTKKSKNLSIKIPVTNSEQSIMNESQAAPITQKSIGSGPGSAVSKNSLNESVIDSSTISTSTKTANTKKGFSFSHLVFDNKSPKSPTRSIWVPQFLKTKLGKEKYEKVVEFLEHTNNPLELLKDQPQPVLDIIGEENKDCLIMLSFLMSYSSNSSTPTSTKETDISRDSDRMSLKGYEGLRSSFNKTPNKASLFSKGVFASNMNSPNNKIEGKK